MNGFHVLGSGVAPGCSMSQLKVTPGSHLGTPLKNCNTSGLVPKGACSSVKWRRRDVVVARQNWQGEGNEKEKEKDGPMTARLWRALQGSTTGVVVATGAALAMWAQSCAPAAMAETFTITFPGSHIGEVRNLEFSSTPCHPSRFVRELAVRVFNHIPSLSRNILRFIFTSSKFHGTYDAIDKL